MIPSREYVSLEGAIASLRRESPEVLKAIAKSINSVNPQSEFNPETITGTKYGKNISGFALTYGQLGAYLNTAVQKHASVLIETEIGVIESVYVLVNREWLRRRYEQASRQPEVIREIAVKSQAAIGTTISPILPHLEDQDPKSALIELKKVKARIDRHLNLRPDSEREAEIERLRFELVASAAREKALSARSAASDKTIKILTRENDQLRKERSDRQLPPSTNSPNTPMTKPKKLSNVEIRNEKARACKIQVVERAQSLWQHDDYAKHRTMDMVHVIRRLADSEPAWCLPKGDTTLARWISSSAPSSAKQPGRPPKKK